MENNKELEGILAEWEVMRLQIKGGLLKGYRNADEWSSHYLDDSMASLKKLDKLDVFLTQAYSIALQRGRKEEKERVRKIIDEYLIIDKTGESVQGGVKGAYNQALLNILDSLSL